VERAARKRDSEEKWIKGYLKIKRKLARKGFMMIREKTDFSLSIIRKKAKYYTGVQ